MRLFYVCNTPLGSYSAHCQEPFYAGAAARKIATTAEAICAAGVPVTVVSAPSVAGGRRVFYPGFRVDGVFSTVYLPAIRSPLANRLFAALNLTRFALSASRNDRVLLYGTYPEFVAAALILRLRRIECILDIEDGLRSQDRSIAGITFRIAYYALRYICTNAQVTVSEVLAERLRLERFIVNYGVAPEQAEISACIPRQSGKLRIWFGGSLAPEWGLELFCDAVRLLALRDWSAAPIQPSFLVTGRGGSPELESLLGDVRGRIELDIAQNLGESDFQRALRRCDVGLDLRMPTSEGAATTFPSKVLEIAGSGLILISTGTSDVPRIFGSEGAVYLAAATPEALDQLIAALCSAPEKLPEQAHRGIAATAPFRKREVGERLVRFLFASEQAVVSSQGHAQ